MNENSVVTDCACLVAYQVFTVLSIIPKAFSRLIIGAPFLGRCEQVIIIAVRRPFNTDRARIPVFYSASLCIAGCAASFSSRNSWVLYSATPPPPPFTGPDPLLALRLVKGLAP